MVTTVAFLQHVGLPELLVILFTLLLWFGIAKMPALVDELKRSMK